MTGSPSSSTGRHVRRPVDLAPVGLGAVAVVVAREAGGPDAGGARRGDEHLRHGASRVRPVAKIALDIDSTLHHYWDLLQRIVLERYGVELPYEDQTDWGITALERDAVIHCVEETHSDENILAGVPYDDAVETVRDWHEAGHWIHVTSHRRPQTRAGHRALARADRHALRRPALLVRQGQPLRRARHRRAGRRQPGEHRQRPRRRDHRRPRSSIPGTRSWSSATA